MTTISRVFSATAVGFHERLIEVEADMSRGLPSLQIVGMGSKAIDEARDRVRSAIQNSSLDFPKGKIIVNLAPAEIPKDGTHFDVPIALALLCLNKQLSPSLLEGALFAGELALDGSIRPIRTPIAIAEAAKNHGFKQIFIPAENLHQAQLIDGVEIIPIRNLKELYLYLKQIKSIDTAATPKEIVATKNHQD